jgi:hypothetical protein
MFCRLENFGHFRIRVGSPGGSQSTLPHLRENVGVTVVKLQPTSPFIPDRYDGTIQLWKIDVESQVSLGGLIHGLCNRFTAHKETPF